MNRVAFYGGLLVVAIGLIVWIVRPNYPSRASKIRFWGIELSSGVPSFVVMALGVLLMILSLQFPGYFSPPKPDITKIVCTGENEGSCPGPHDIFYTCGYFGSDDEIAQRVCTGIKSGALRLKTVGGNKCGYALIEITCHTEP